MKLEYRAFLRASACTILLGALAATSAMAQDRAQNPNYGTVDLNAGFTPDPYVVDVDSGGSIPASNVSSACSGMISNAPDLRLNYRAGSGVLPLILTAASNYDLTMVVNAPDGRWYCDDDGGEGLNPLLRFDRPMGGAYEIWLGTYGSSDNYPAQVIITELESNISGGVPASQSGRGGSSQATYGVVSLRSGFTPDPYVVSLSSGGGVNGTTIAEGCAGYFASAPDVSLDYTAGSLPLFMTTDSSADTTLMVRAPDGNWYCDDDRAGNANALVAFGRPGTGRYDIWVGTYGEAANYPTDLRITEIDHSWENSAPPPRPMPRPVPPRPAQQSSGPDVGAQAIYETVNLTSGFTPDPYIVRMSSGGSNDASRVSSACNGFIATSPDVRLNYTAGSLPLIISATSMADTTLVINAPNGQWYCDDDGGQGVNPSVRFQTPLSGRYEIWVGTYGAAEVHAAELNISELYSQ